MALMSSEVVQTEQRKANLEAITRLGFAAYPHKFDTTHSVTQLVEANGAKTGAELESAKVETDHRRPHRQHPQLRQGQLPRAVRRPLAPAGLRPAGRAERARLPAVEAARRRRSDRRRRTSVPHQDQRVVDLGVDAGVSRQVLPAAAGEVARPAGRRDPLPPALSRSGRQSGRAPRVRDPHAAPSPRFAIS